MPEYLEIELVDIGFIENGRRSKQYVAVFIDRVFAKFTGGKCVTRLALDLAAGDGIQRVDCQVAQVRGIPQGEFGGSAALNIVTHLVGGAQAGHEYFADQVCIRDSASGGGDANGGWSNDDLQVWIFLEQALGLLVAGRIIIVAVDG